MESLRIIKLTFIRPDGSKTDLLLERGINLIYGASNTGKSFGLKAIDFMMGKLKTLPDIPQFKEYEKIELDIETAPHQLYRIIRSTLGGKYTVINLSINPQPPGIILNPIHDGHNRDNISSFFLEPLGLLDKLIASEGFGSTKSLSFRNVVELCFADETDIQSERSPIQTGQHPARTLENNVFKFFLTGKDDSSLVSGISPSKLNAIKKNKVELLDEMILSINNKISNTDTLEICLEKHGLFTKQIEALQAEIKVNENTLKSLAEQRASIGTRLTNTYERLAEVKNHLDRFHRLNSIYQSDIDRLKGLEEAGFLLFHATGQSCPLCGAESANQAHVHDVDNIDQIKTACEAEVLKIELQSKALIKTITELDSELNDKKYEIENVEGELKAVESEISKLNPVLQSFKSAFTPLLEKRDKLQNLISLHEQVGSYELRKKEIQGIKAQSKADKPDLRIPKSNLFEFCEVFSKVLKAWNFPGNHKVSFDESTYDVIIDGKSRIDNGKGVRAITHAAFKISLLVYCREKGLPHPGLVILDTPLLTFRDAIQHSKHGALSADEVALSKTTLNFHFFEYLNSIKHYGQFIVFENINPPIGVEKFANIEMFTGNPSEGRMGLL